MLLSRYTGEGFIINGRFSGNHVGYYCKKCNRAFPITGDDNVIWKWKGNTKIGTHKKCKSMVTEMIDDREYHPASKPSLYDGVARA